MSFVNLRSWLEAATVITQGETWFTFPLVVGSVLKLPPEAATKIPASKASKNANSTGSLYGFFPPEME